MKKKDILTFQLQLRFKKFKGKTVSDRCTIYGKDKTVREREIERERMRD